MPGYLVPEEYEKAGRAELLQLIKLRESHLEEFRKIDSKLLLYHTLLEKRDENGKPIIASCTTPFVTLTKELVILQAALEQLQKELNTVTSLIDVFQQFDKGGADYFQDADLVVAHIKANMKAKNGQEKNQQT